MSTSDIGAALTAPWPIKSSPVGVTTRSSTVVAFDRSAAAYITGDTVYASVHGAPYRIPLADVQRVSVVRVDKAMSLLVTVGLVGIVVVALAEGAGMFPNLGSLRFR